MPCQKKDDQKTARKRQPKPGRSLSEGIRKPTLPKLTRNNSADFGETLQFLGELLENVLPDKSFTGSDLYVMGLCLSDTTDEDLNQAFLFSGYEGRAREAILTFITFFALDESPVVRNKSYRELGKVGSAAELDFLIRRAFDDCDEVAFIGIKQGIAIFMHDKPAREKNAVALRLKELLDNDEIKLEVCRLFIDLNTKFSITTALADIVTKEDAILAERLMAYPFLFNLPRRANPPILAKFVDTIATLERIPVDVFMHITAHIEDITSFIDLLDGKTISRLLEAETQVIDDLHNLAYQHFKHAATGALFEAQMGDQHLQYFVLPEEMLSGTGRFYHYAYVVSDLVPERLRPIVAYHEYIERQTQSHEKAAEAEIQAVISLGLEKEYVAWVESRADVLNGRAELLEQLRETSIS